MFIIENCVLLSMNNKESKEPSSENNPSNIGVTEMIIEDLKTIESSSALLMEALTTITRRAKQARQLLEIQTKQLEKPGPQHNFYGGPWSRALKAMSERDRRLERGERV